MTAFKNALSVAFHPIEGWNDLFYKKKSSMAVANILSLLVFIVCILKRQLTGFIFNPADPEDLNIWYILASSLLLMILFTVVNWAVCTLFNGNGGLKKIWIVTTYSAIPYILSTVLYILCSNYLKSQESLFLTIILYFGYAWTVFLLVKGLEEIHEYSIPQTISSILATVFGILCIIFLLVLLFSLSQQLASFFVTIGKELIIRTK